ncbi:ATP-grasp domain-containing protein [Marinicrinis sediminis]|uniref:RimK family alpha-L-glutamate ligase n=1 Tax=Marinicrinis sediminis TaxID=1652465 RepID=A0ABW5R9W1_9BACL
MKLLTFNPFRTIGIPHVEFVKPTHMFQQIELIKEADVLLFPEHWQVNSLVYGLHKPIFPSIQTIHLGHNKIEMTRALQMIVPEHVPYTEIVSNTPEHQQMILDTFSFPFVAKEVKNSRGQGVFLIRNRAEFKAYADRNDSLYIQMYIPTHQDLRVCVVGREIVTAYWRVAEGNFLHNVAQGGTISLDHIPAKALDLVLQTAEKLQIDHAGFDLIFDGDTPYFLEFNVLFGNQGIIQQGISVEQKIYQYICNEYVRPPFPTTPSPTVPFRPVSA